jgi:hypothetical protein
MKKRILILLPAVLALILTTGCYTQFYRPGMERPMASDDKLYNRNDSTAIDTTLTPGGGASEYPNNDDRWQYWGRPRGYTNWGFDFNNFEPGYYWSYYGYYDYYSQPWWYDPYYDPYHYWSPGGYGGGGSPAEPQGRRGGDRSRDSGGGGSYVSPPPSGGSYVSPPPPPPKKDDSGATKDQGSSGDANKRGGGRGH